MKGFFRLLLSMLVFASVNKTWATETDFSAFLGGEVWDASSASGHGIVSLRTDFSGLSRGGRGFVEFNTDTLRLSVDELGVGVDTVVGGSITGELGVSNLLTDFFFAGDNDPSRGFFASYLMGSVWLKQSPANHLYITVEGTGRRWSFQPTALTDPDLSLPANSSALEPALHLTWWGLADDLAWGQPHRLVPRLRGFAAGLTLRGVVLSEATPWGGVADQEGATQRINSPDDSMLLFSQWALFGQDLWSSGRLELSERASYMNGEDDLYRTVIGGMSPYSVSIPGVPWGYYHAGDYAAVAGRLALRPVLEVDLELGPAFGWATIRDEQRSGGSGFSSQYGFGAFGELRVGPWQYEVRAGYSPSLDAKYDHQDALSLFFLCGWSTLK